MIAMNLTVLRLPGYCDGVQENGISLQPFLGQYDELGFKKLDKVLCTAE